MGESMAQQEAALLVALARLNVPTDVQELLVRGDPMRSIPPHALVTAHHAALRVFLNAALSDPQPQEEGE